MADAQREDRREAAEQRGAAAVGWTALSSSPAEVWGCSDAHPSPAPCRKISASRGLSVKPRSQLSWNWHSRGSVVVLALRTSGESLLNIFMSVS